MAIYMARGRSLKPAILIVQATDDAFIQFTFDVDTCIEIKFIFDDGTCFTFNVRQLLT